jgi:ATP-dependent DNA helicase DinG
MDIPWDALGLSRFGAAADGRRLLFESGAPGTDVASVLWEGIPLVTFDERESTAPAGQAVYSLRLLARVLHPTLPSHRLEAVCERHCVAMREDGLPGTIGELLVSLVGEAMGLDRGVVALLAQLLPPPLSGLFKRILLLPVREPFATSSAAAEEIGPSVTSPPATVEAALGPDGFVARSLPAYELRPGQLDMANRVAEVFRAGGAGVIEAGPGIGKTFAYLIPAILRLREDASLRVVVSTRTKQLQDQLYTKDVPFLLAHMVPGMKVALLKGRENYLCLRRWDITVRELSEGLQRDRLSQLAPLARWLSETETGDIEENAAFLSDSAASELWGRLCDSPFYCVGGYCPYAENCFSVLARRRARNADLVVVNHSLLLGDSVAAGAVLGPFTHLIVDEAHAFEAAARSAFTVSLSQRAVERVVEELVPLRGGRGGWLRQLPLPMEDGEVRRAGELAATVRTQTARVLSQVEPLLPDERRSRLPDIGLVRGELERLSDLFERTGDAVDGLVDRVVEEPQLVRQSEGIRTGLRELAAAADALGGPPEDDMVHWFENDAGSLSLHITPLDVGAILSDKLYSSIDAIVLTSATLSLGGDFDYPLRALGLGELAGTGAGVVVEDPFSYEMRMRVCVPTDLPSVQGDEEEYAESLSSFLVQLHRRVPRNGLVLFTSYSLLNAVWERIHGRTPVLAQGIDGPRNKLVERFRRARDGMLLLGTDSFWEGVDLPGEELEVLVVTRLPFAVPSDPVLSALAERCVHNGRDPFRDLCLPQAILRLRQGVGRLIRTQSDRGVVIVTDDRIVMKGYGSEFVRSLPIRVERFERSADLVSEVANWFRHSAGQ